MLAKSLLCLVAIGLSLAPKSHGQNQNQNQTQDQASSMGSTSSTVTYHGGRLLTKKNGINVYVIWYGAFSVEDRTAIIDFFDSFDKKKVNKEPSVFRWWKAIGSYKDKAKISVSGTVKLAKQNGDVYSLGKSIKRQEIGELVMNKIKAKKLPVDGNGIYLVFTATDVTVENFCRSSCGFHDSIEIEKIKVVYAHVGDSSDQCPGFCAWPYAIPSFGPPGQKALLAPNGVGADGLIINIATIIAGAATNPFKDGYFQGDALAPLEAVTACPGIFGAGAFPGNPGNLIVDKATNASFNVYGSNDKKFLLPAIWDLKSSTCKAVAASPAT